MAKKESNVGMKVLEIREISFSNKLTDYVIENFQENKLIFKLGISVNGIKSENIINLLINVNYLMNDEKNPKKPIEFLNMETETSFKLDKPDEIHVKYHEDGKRIFIHDELMALFLNVGIGATRGMLAYKVASLPINLVLPMVDLSNFIDQKKEKKK
jgi:hypothetical protein